MAFKQREGGDNDKDRHAAAAVTSVVKYVSSL